MKLDYAHTYDADPQRVVALMRTKDFLEDVANHAGAVSHDVEVTDDHATLGMKLPVPSSLRKFVGEAIQINMIFRFAEARQDGVVPGSVEVDVPGMPVEVNATAELHPSGTQTKGTTPAT
ncbi:DUF2505 family protein [Tessaracoccus sp. HDW20]|uniref:DUF2505 family protein n=1 Tax=Tessaracoccus coleopterorum TaxID=2714950 RepID=UPI0018D3AE30|nr:DUF2505 family protein [Tessaracoccus coleopterorum]NHB83712.1 DUF2505 family protein [Tessaracoccus coleopterorum]